MLHRRLILAGLASTLASTALAHDTTVHNVSGAYTAFGMNADGSKYSGQVQISQTGNAVELFWTVGSQQYSGRGLIQGSVVTVDWGAATPVIYVLVGNELHGTWNGGTALERLVRR